MKKGRSNINGPLYHKHRFFENLRKFDSKTIHRISISPLILLAKITFFIFLRVKIMAL